MVLGRFSVSEGAVAMLPEPMPLSRLWRTSGVGPHPSVPMVVSFEEHWQLDKEGKTHLEDIEVKEGKPPDSKMNSAFSPELHGRTTNNEACRCLPGDIEPPSTSTLMRRAMESQEVDRELHRESYRERIDQVNSGTEEELKVNHQKMKLRDWAFADLKIYAERMENDAKEMKQGFDEAKAVYEESDCQRLKEDAEEHGEEIPKCHVEFEKAAKEMKAINMLVKPKCKIGAVRLQPLQEIVGEKREKSASEMSSLPLSVVSAVELLLRNLSVSPAAVAASGLPSLPGKCSSMPELQPRSLASHRLRRHVAASHAFL